MVMKWIGGILGSDRDWWNERRVWPDGKMKLLTKQLTIKKSWLRDILINLRLPSQVSLLLAQLIFRCSLPLKKNVWKDWPEIIVIIIYLMFYIFIFYTWSNYLRSVWSHPQRFGTLSVHFLCTFMSHAEKKFINILSMFIWESKHQDIPFFDRILLWLKMKNTSWDIFDQREKEVSWLEAFAKFNSYWILNSK